MCILLTAGPATTGHDDFFNGLLGGFSGGGLFDLDGNVVGVLTGSEWEPNKDAMVVRVLGCSTAAMRSIP